LQGDIRRIRFPGRWIYSLRAGEFETFSDLPPVADWGEHLKLSFEKDVLGLYLSGHPLQKYEQELKSFPPIISLNTRSLQRRNLYHWNHKQSYYAKTQKNGNRYAVANLEDLSGTLEVFFFSKI
jgi:DNA polymerase-3 subunit alpha